MGEEERLQLPLAQRQKLGALFWKRFARHSKVSRAHSLAKAKNQALLTVSNWKSRQNATQGEGMSEQEQWMKLSDVADEARLALSTVYYLHKEGKGPKFSRLGRNIRVKRSDFDEWFESNREN